MPSPFISKGLHKVSITDNTPYAQSVKGILDNKGKSIYNRIKDFIYGKSILDVGSGVGGVAYQLKKQNYDITTIDVVDLSLISEMTPTIYDGEHIPFKDGEFDTALIVQVLHHCKDGLQVLREAKRVAKRVILIEDTYRNSFEKFVVSINDMIGNSQFYFHPYHPTSWWKEVAEKEGWKIVHCSEYSEFTYKFLYGRYTFLVVE
jgi:SAM-dependent methyltransferase